MGLEVFCKLQKEAHWRIISKDISAYVLKREAMMERRWSRKDHAKRYLTY